MYAAGGMYDAAMGQQQYGAVFDPAMQQAGYPDPNAYVQQQEAYSYEAAAAYAQYYGHGSGGYYQ